MYKIVVSSGKFPGVSVILHKILCSEEASVDEFFCNGYVEI